MITYYLGYICQSKDMFKKSYFFSKEKYNFFYLIYFSLEKHIDFSVYLYTILLKQIIDEL